MYELHAHQLWSNGGLSLAKKYNDSIPNLLKDTYPEIDWLPWKFAMQSENTWKDFINHRRFFDWLAEEIQLNFPEQWYDQLKKSTVLEKVS
jgi:hypothetical protein